jgi:hypothetical protein
MNGERKTRKRWRNRVMLVALVLLAGAALVYALGMKLSRGVTPKLVNQTTAAREVRQLSAKPDKRFAPLPIEEEKHQQ